VDNDFAAIAKVRPDIQIQQLEWTDAATASVGVLAPAATSHHLKVSGEGSSAPDVMTVR
jgi:hypothetical protein